MSKVSDKTVCVVDHGLFFPLAQRLVRDFGRVLYYTPWEKGFPLINDCVIGDGFEDVERIDDIWESDFANLYVFPDIQHSGLQAQLANLGARVFGSRNGDRLELMRGFFKDKLKDAGLPVGEYQVVRGLDELRALLKKEDDLFVKISKYRGCMESWHHVNYDLSLPMLDSLAVKFGPLQDAVPFIVESPLKTDIEVGYDGFCIDGQFSPVCLQGYEAKDKGLIAAVSRYKDLPEEITRVNEALAPILKAYRYRNFFSTEIRVLEGESYLIDPCCRCPSPCVEIQLEIWENLSEMIWEGAEGNMVEAEPAAKFGVEAMIEHTGDHREWRVMQVPDEIKDRVKLFNVCQHNGQMCFPPFPHSCPVVGAVVGLGDTILEAIDDLKATAEALEGQAVKIQTQALAETLADIREAEKKGVEFTDQEVPKPEEAMK